MSLENITTTILAQTFLDRLRTKTGSSHKNLENLPVSVSIVSPTLTVAQYHLYLSLMHDVIFDAETRIFQWLQDIIPDLQQRHKLPFLNDDLLVLGFEKQTVKPVFDNAKFSPAFALGVMYVVEGSSLGGRFILKNIDATLGFNENRGATYFAGYGNHTGSRWKEFLNALIAYEAAHDCSDEIIAGAKYGFNAIHKHFSKAVV